MIVRVMAEDEAVCQIAERLLPEADPLLRVATFRTPGAVVNALALLQWELGTYAVVDLGMRGLLGGEVVDYIASHHPVIGLWGIGRGRSATCRAVFAKAVTPWFFRWFLTADIAAFCSEREKG